MATPNLYLRSRFAAKLLLPAALGMTLLASCGLLSKPSAKAPAKGSDATTAAGEFKFPQATCGEEASTPSENWYPVYIDGAELSAIRSQYCANAISEVRSKTGAPTVQVASFTSYEKAKKFATAVGGEVGVVGSAPATTESSSTGSSQALATGRTATLNSAEKGSPINIRQSASTDASVQEVAYSGDSIKVSSKTEGTDGFTWYKVELNSGASGWVRSDLISAGDSGTRTSTRPATRTPEDAATTATRTEGGTRDSASVPPSSSTPATDSSTIAAAPPDSSAPSSSSTVTEAPPTATTRPSSTASSSSGSTASGRTATISTRDPDSPINVRSAAGTSSDVQDVAYGGDRIQITDTQQGDDGQTWYKVQFESGASGWVRSDFVGN
jgi:uncharacterized protein YgiM (DUF1202 family)